MVRSTAFKSVILLAAAFLVKNGQAGPVGVRSRESVSDNNNDEYSDAQVWRITLPPNQARDITMGGLPRARSSRAIGAEILSIASGLNLDVWKSTAEFIDILLPTSNHMDQFQLLLGGSDLISSYQGSNGKSSAVDGNDAFTWEPLQSNLAPLILSSSLPPSDPNTPAPTLNLSSIYTHFHDSYHPLGPISDSQSIYGFLEALREKWPRRVEVVTLGKSFEGREIRGVKIHVVEGDDGNGQEDDDEDEDDDPDDDDDNDEEEAQQPGSMIDYLENIIDSWNVPYLKSTIITLINSYSPFPSAPPIPSSSSSSSQSPFNTSSNRNRRKSKHHKKKKGKGKNPSRPEQPPTVPPNPNPPESRKGKEIFMMGGQHAREWVSPSTIMYFAHYLLLESESNSDIMALLKEFTFMLVPTINPDGYVYSQEHSRLWKKNRQEVGSKTCKGIDLNANWGYQWDTSLKSNPCSETYPGEHAFEAVETKVVSDYLRNATTNVRGFVDLHSYGQLFMFPYSYSCEDFPKDAETLMEAGLGVAKAVKADAGTQYKAGQACDLVYRMAGDAIDWAYGQAGIRFSYSAELRDTGTYGFLLPPHLIRATASELTSGLIYLAKFIKSNEAAA